MNIPVSASDQQDLAHWLGVEAKESIISTMLLNGGVPITRHANSIEMNRVWVILDGPGINGPVQLDPAFKSSIKKSGIDLANAIGYDQSTLLSDVGGVVDNDSIQNLNSVNLNTRLNSLSTQLVGYLKQNNSTDHVRDVLGGLSIIPIELNSLPSLPFAGNATESPWSEIPSSYIHTIRLQHGGIDTTLNIPEIAGKKLSISYLAGNSNQAQIHLDDSLLVSEGTVTTGYQTDLTIDIDHPYNGDHADQNNVRFALKRGNIYVLASGFGGDRNSKLLAERQRKLSVLMGQNLGNDSREVVSETLNIIGQNWFQQTQLNNEILVELSNQRFINHHRFGIIAQEDSYYLDIKAQSASLLPTASNTKLGVFKGSSFIASGMEHSVLEQLQGVDNPGISTVKIFDLNNQNGDKFFLAKQSNFSNVKTQLSGYSASTISSIENSIQQGFTFILPKNGQVTLNNWSGAGYVSHFSNQTGTEQDIQMAIGGGLNGGFSSFRRKTRPTFLSKKTYPKYIPTAVIPPTYALDPVDLGSGAYLNESTDLSLSGGMQGLAFSRSYNSQQVNQNIAYISPGWNHSYNIYLTQQTDTSVALGKRTPIDAAALMVAAVVTRDLMDAIQPTLKAWVTSALVGQWATSQLIDKAVSVHIGDRVLTYRQQANGSFTPPPGVTTSLIKKSDGTFELRERFGKVLIFNNKNKIQSLTDIDGNSLTFTYVDEKLTQVKDSYNRTLTLRYNAANQLDQVSDSEGRSVHYHYNDGNLSLYQDAENKRWEYSYDNLNQILTVKDPVNMVIVDNTYDVRGRVIQQIAPRETGPALYKLHYTGLSSAEEDPLGNRTTYHYDFTGRTIAVENALGQKNKVEYDGQGQAIKQTDARGNISMLRYDAHNNLVEKTNALHQTSQLSYDSLHRLKQFTDALNHSTTIEYDSKHHPFRVTDAENNSISKGYLGNGLIHRSTDARNSDTVYTYDHLGQLKTTKTASHPAVTSQYDSIGRLSRMTDQAGATTTFSYDKRSLATQRTDPLGQTSTSVYDDAGRITRQTDRNGDTISTGYTATSKLDWISYPGNQSVRFDYDSRDNLETMVDKSGTTRNRYDALNRLIEHIDPNNFQVKYQYDAVGNLIKLTYPGNKTVSYGYDLLNRLKTVTVDWLQNKPTTNYHYDAAGRQNQTDLFNGSKSQYRYDKADRLKGITHKAANQTLANYQYTLDPNGNRVKALVDAPQLPEKLINHSLHYNYNAEKNRLNRTNKNTYTYDKEGQQKTRDTTTYRYDYAHRLIRQGNNHYTYDGVGNRIRATRNGQTTKYIYDAAGNLLAEVNNQNQFARYYIYGHGMLGFVDAATNQLYTYHHDGTGHTVAITDQNQQTINTYAYDPYGRLMGESENIKQPFKYVGQLGVFAEGGDLYYMRARYYDAQIGRFISEDPIGMAGGLNLYAYVGGNPLILVDPSGLGSTEAGLSNRGRINRVSAGASILPFTNAKVVIYDHKAGFFPSSRSQVEVSTTALGAGLSFSFDTGLQANKAPIGSEIGVQLGQSRYLSFGTNSSLNSFDVNLGIGIALPGVGFSKVIQEALP